MAILTVENLTKDYGEGKGVFDVSFDVAKGEVFGFLGSNGAGKTTTIRHLLGFSKPQSGKATIKGLDAWTDAKEIKKSIGYLPGEIAFPNDMKGSAYIKYIADLRGLKDMTKADNLIKQFEVDPSGDLNRMSKGMKQKIGIVCAFMHDPEILILDEPTSGLDPLMQANFVQLIQTEKANGWSILMSSHMFEEVEETCDRIGMIKNGQLISIVDPKNIKRGEKKTFKIEFLTFADYQSICNEGFQIKEQKPEFNQVTIDIEDTHINKLLLALSKRQVRFISEVKHTLEEYFMSYYEGGNHNV
ncbi:ABC-2 type transport system ATP-binding protein [Enterococcus sp. PF1-24]|uniref:ABC transporter ATP-binding protein n=1 Tax=unclassified Enterococcus TaxID=2608891 RepID=UPI0024739BE7|nr:MULTISPECIES: ABC transporter ATP-binding protein [unclassified Enterococcus]MDH6365636.1 ABC-2 type transport system ATP-binding protein [Enterococcus sp. PFB1-1]MDH6402737.1 ABC-2 type transport system ATP-binding protein [Enterococcus sp. PF1-24]